MLTPGLLTAALVVLLSTAIMLVATVKGGSDLATDGA